MNIRYFFSRNIILILIILAFVIVFGVTIAANSLFNISLLKKLADALQFKKLKIIDQILEELATKTFDAATITALEQISDDVLIAEYDKALETVTTLLENINK